METAQSKEQSIISTNYISFIWEKEVKTASEWFRDQNSILSQTRSSPSACVPLRRGTAVPENVWASGITVICLEVGWQAVEAGHQASINEMIEMISFLPACRVVAGRSRVLTCSAQDEVLYQENPNLKHVEKIPKPVEMMLLQKARHKTIFFISMWYQYKNSFLFNFEG